MGEIEKKMRMTRRKKLILETIYASGIIATVMIAPNVAKLAQKIKLKKNLEYNEFYSYFKTLKQLESKGLIKKSIKFGRDVVELTKEGVKTLEFILPLRNQKWDGRWRVLIFDIPEHRRSVRTKIRNTLREKGFHRIQDSVWVIPYDCEDLVTLMKADLKVGKDLLYMIVDSIEGDRRLKDIFGLNLK
jgi:DNA-binding transcriptional regulator PaaX